MPQDPRGRPRGPARSKLLRSAVAALLLVAAAGVCHAQDPPGEPLSTGSGSDTEKLNEALDALHCAVDAMDEEDPNRKKAEKALDAALKAAKGKQNPETGEFEPRIRKKDLPKKGHDAYTSPEADDGTSVSGTEGVGEGNEYVVIDEPWFEGSGSANAAALAGLLAHEGTRLTAKYKYPKKGQSKQDKCNIINASLDAWNLQLAVLEALAGKEQDPDEKKKIEDRITDAETARDSWQQNKDALGC